MSTLNIEIAAHQIQQNTQTKKTEKELLQHEIGHKRYLGQAA